LIAASLRGQRRSASLIAPSIEIRAFVFDATRRRGRNVTADEFLLAPTVNP